MAQVFHTKGMGLRARNKRRKPGVELHGRFKMTVYPRDYFFGRIV